MPEILTEMVFFIVFVKKVRRFLNFLSLSVKGVSVLVGGGAGSEKVRQSHAFFFFFDNFPSGFYCERTSQICRSRSSLF